MNAKTHKKMQEYVAIIKNRQILIRALREELLRYICPEPVYDVSLDVDDKGEVVLHFNQLLDVPHEDTKHLPTIADARTWADMHAIELTSLGIDSVQFHTVSHPVHALFVTNTESRIGEVISQYLQKYEELRNPKTPWIDFLRKEAGVDGVISLTQKVLGALAWEKIVKRVLVATGRYREDLDGTIVRL